MSKRSRRRPVAPVRSAGPRPASRARTQPIAVARHSSSRWPIVALAALGVGIAIVAFVLATSTPSGATGTTPWPADPAGLQQRLQTAGLQVLTAEGQVLHIHQHLDLYVDGARVTVPGGIGIDTTAGIISPIHTHDATGIVHVESPVVRDFTLGQVFDVWGVTFDAHCLGTTCDGNGRVLSVFSNGQPVSGDPRALVLQPHAEIVVAIGTTAQLPSPIPSSYQFPAGY